MLTKIEYVLNILSHVYMPENSEFTSAFFDDSSAAWRLNKIVQNGGTFHYKCQATSVSRGRLCGKKVYMKPGMIPMTLYCWHHRQTQPFTTTENS